jgi:hypothetical protein
MPYWGPHVNYGFCRGPVTFDGAAPQKRDDSGGAREAETSRFANVVRGQRDKVAYYSSRHSRPLAAPNQLACFILLHHKVWRLSGNHSESASLTVVLLRGGVPRGCLHVGKPGTFQTQSKIPPLLFLAIYL